MRPRHQLPHASATILVTSAVCGSTAAMQPERWWPSTAGRCVFNCAHILFAKALTAMVATMVLASPMANATPICVWLDEAGGTHYASVVPEPYKAVANCTDSQEYELSPEQKSAAEQAKIAREDRAVKRLDAAKLAASSAWSPPRVAGKAPRTVTKQPAEVVTESTDCPTWWRLYDESAECFGPYRTTQGATRVEAFSVCNAVPSPEPKCGLRSN